MIRHAVLGMLFAAVSLPGGVRAQEKSETKLLTLQARVLEEELALAKLPHVYFLLDLKEKRLDLKAGGTLMRSWELLGVRAWGAPREVRTSTLAVKSALFPPARVEIIPGGEEETQTSAPEKDAEKKPAAGSSTAASSDPYELEALELKDMPKSFQMVFDEGLRISVRGAGPSLGSTLGRIWGEVRWSIGRPLEAVWNKSRNKPFRVIDLTLKDDKEAQALYWSFFDGIKGLVWYMPKK